MLPHRHTTRGIHYTLEGIAPDRSSFKNVGVAFALTLIFAVVELVGGIFIHSSSIISIAIHAIGDSMMLATAWFLERLALRQPNIAYSFGYRRLSLLSAVVGGILILTASIGMLWHVLPELTGIDFFASAGDGGGHGHGHGHTHGHGHGHEHHAPNSLGMFLLALLGIAVNVVAVIVLNRGRSLNEKMLTWHMVSHTLSWISILVVSVILMFFDVPLLDSILSVFIIAFILRSVIYNLWQSLKLFLQAVPFGVDIEKLCDEAKKRVEGVIDLHDVRVWSLDGTSHVFSSHVVVNEDTGIRQMKSIKAGIREIVAEIGVGEFYTTLEFESEEETCLAKVWGKT